MKYINEIIINFEYKLFCIYILLVNLENNVFLFIDDDN